MQQEFYDPTKTIAKPPLPLPQSQTSKSKPKWLISLLLIIFPPLAMYFMYKDETYHKWFGTTNITIAVSMIIFLLAQLFFVNPMVSTYYKSISVKNPVPQVTIVSEVTLFIFIVGIGMSIWFLRIKKDAQEYKTALIIMVIFLLGTFVLSWYISDYVLTTLLKPILNLQSLPSINSLY